MWQVKTTQRDGVILYSGTPTGRDFLALELFDGQVRYVYDVGAGARTLRVNLRYSISDNRWHSIAVVRSTLSQVTADTLTFGRLAEGAHVCVCIYMYISSRNIV